MIDHSVTSEEQQVKYRQEANIAKIRVGDCLSDPVKEAVEAILKCNSSIEEAKSFLAEKLPVISVWKMDNSKDDEYFNNRNKGYATVLFSSILVIALAILNTDGKDASLLYFKETSEAFFEGIPEEQRECPKAKVFNQEYQIFHKRILTVTGSPVQEEKPISFSKQEKLLIEVDLDDPTSDEPSQMARVASATAYAGDRALHGGLLLVQMPAIVVAGGVNLFGAEVPTDFAGQREQLANTVTDSLSSATSYAASFLPSWSSGQTD